MAEESGRLAAVLADCDVLRGEPRTVEPVEGGLTNVNVKVTAPGCTAVVRLSSSDGDLLAIDRDAEDVNSRRAAASGAAPEVLAYLPQHQALVVRWIEGRTLVADDLRAATMLERLATVCRMLHSGPRFVTDFDMVEIQRRYLRIVQERGFRLPDGYLDLEPAVAAVREALDVRRGPTVPCNNDLLAANVVDDGSRLWLIDYEYGGNNDPCFELGNVWSESELTDDELRVLVDAYAGERVRHLVARARLFGVLARHGWTLWASIQDSVSTIDFDFWSWGMQKYDLAVADLEGPDLGRLMAEARRPD